MTDDDIREAAAPFIIDDPPADWIEIVRDWLSSDYPYPIEQFGLPEAVLEALSATGLHRDDT
jgi:hypothetical protein